MDVNLMKACLAVMNAQAVFVMSKSPITHASNFLGVVTDLTEDARKCRLAILDASTFALVRDDTDDIQHITVSIKHILKLEPVLSIHYKPTDELKEIAIQLLEKSTIERSILMDVYQDYVYHTYDITRFDTWQALTMDDLSASKRTRLFENCVSIQEGDKTIPILSDVFVYDVTTQSYVKKQRYFHNASKIKKYFKHFGFELNHKDTVKQAIEHGYEIDETPYKFRMTPKLSRWEKTRLDTMESMTLNRPLRACLNRLTPKNMGRKPYKLNFDVEKGAIFNNRVIFSHLKHPVTTLQKDSAFDLDTFMKQTLDTIRANNHTVLVLDPDMTFEGDAFNYPILDMRDQQALDESLDRLREALDGPPPSEKPVDYALFEGENLEKQTVRVEQWTQRKMFARSVNATFHETSAFHETVAIESYLQTLDMQTPAISLKTLFKHIQNAADFEKVIEHITHARLRRLRHKAYKGLLDCLHMNDKGERRKKFFALLKQPPTFHQIKQVCQTVIVSHTRRLPDSENSFNQMIAIHPMHDHMLNFIFSDKLLVIDDYPSSLHQIKPYSITWPYLYNPSLHRLIDVLHHQSPRAVKAFDTHPNLPYRGLDVISYVSDTENHPHQSHLEARRILKHLQQHPLNWAVLTPFNAQRKLLKQTFPTWIKNRVHTLHSTHPSEHVIVSLAMHKATSQETYDWLKNNPAIIARLNQLKTFGCTVFTDMDVVSKHSSGHDPLYLKLKAASTKHAGLFSQNKVLDFERFLIRKIQQHGLLYKNTEGTWADHFPALKPLSGLRIHTTLYDPFKKTCAVLCLIEPGLYPYRYQQLETHAKENGIEIFTTSRYTLSLHLRLLEIFEATALLKPRP